MSMHVIKSLKIQKGQSESSYWRRRDKRMVKRKSTKRQTTISKILQLKNRTKRYFNSTRINFHRKNRIWINMKYVFTIYRSLDGNAISMIGDNTFNNLTSLQRLSLKIPKGQSESSYWRRRDKRMAKGKSTKRQTTMGTILSTI
jgi:hypothetical protein